MAIDCGEYSRAISNGETPYLKELVCPLIGVINIALGVAAAIFVIFIVYGAIKASMALGDPKALKGASQTWTYAVIGVLVILASFSIVIIVTRLLGINIGRPSDLLDMLWSALEGLENVSD